jgi:hypothetical protein
VIIRCTVAGWGIEGSGDTLEEALEGLASECDRFAQKNEKTAAEAAIDAAALRRTAAGYRAAAAHSPAVGITPAAPPDNEQETDDGHDSSSDFEVGEKG